MKYVDIVVDNNTNATDQIYTYSCDDDSVCPGQKVIVPFSKSNRQIDGYVISVNSKKPDYKTKSVISLCDEIINEEALKTAIWMKERYLCRYIEAIKCFTPNSEVKKKIKDPFENIVLSDSAPKDLNEEQQDACDCINAAIDMNEHKIFLVHGVTGSGKTEVYMQCMQRAIDQGRQGIILVPEISLTPQLVSRFMSRFGKGSVAVLHSKLTPAQRAVEYERIQSGKVSIVIGARSAIFAPFANIGLIVLDEEHETSYKSDKSPKYDAVEVAAKRAMTHGAVLILGSATPSVNDYYRSENKIFNRIELKERYNKTPLPESEIVDMTKEVRSGNRDMFSASLIAKMKQTLDEGKQIILFLNRRGYSSYVSCRECGYTVKCSDCGIAMPYHKDDNACVCHYCGKKIRIPKVCPKCSSKIIGRYGVGTQQVEEHAKEVFPSATVDRLDLDSIKKKGELEDTLKRFGKGETDILVGTQIVAKGLDFSNVGLVGIISADVTLNIPDFRSSERTFQLITQAAGRAGRGNEKGKVVVQTYTPESFALLCAADNDYKAFYQHEIKIRSAAGYPPFSDLYQLLIMDESESVAEKSAKSCANWLRRNLGKDVSVLGPSSSALVKQGGMYRYQVLIKAPKKQRKMVSRYIAELKTKFATTNNVAELLTVDINPFSFM